MDYLVSVNNDWKYSIICFYCKCHAPSYFTHKIKKKPTIQNDIIRFSIQLFVVCVYISYVHGNLENKKKSNKLSSKSKKWWENGNISVRKMWMLHVHV